MPRNNFKNPIIVIKGWQDGASLNDKLGKRNGFEIGVNADFGSKLGYIAPGYAWRNVQFGGSDNMPTRFERILHLTNGEVYFGGQDARIYRNDGLNAIVLARTSTQTGTIVDMVEYKRFLIYAQATTLGRYGDLTGTPSWTDNWRTGLANVLFHPLLVSVDDEVYIGNRNRLDRWDGTTYSSGVMEIGDDGWIIRCLEDFGEQFIAIGASYQKTAGQSLRAKIFLWDREIARWNDEIPIPERDIKAMKLVPGYLWVWAGRSCNVYVIPLNSRTATKMLTFVREEPFGEFEVYPNSIVERGGVIHFALSRVGANSRDKNPCGIYSFPADPTRWSLNIPFTTYFDGLGHKERFHSLGILRGSVDTVGDMIFASYWDTINNKQFLFREMAAEADVASYRNEAIVQSFVFQMPGDRECYLKDFIIRMLPFPLGCSLSLFYQKNRDGNWLPIIENFSTAGKTEIKQNKVIRFDNLQLRIVLRGSLTGLARPFVESICGRGAVILKF